MIKSMTGFGRCELSDDYHKITVELKSVNHRYFDVNIKMPRKLNFFESAIRTLLKDYIQRGKVDVFIACEDLSQRDVQVRYNRAIAGEYLGYLREMAADFELEDDIRVSTLSRYPEVFSMEEAGIDENEIWQLLEEALKNALDQFVSSRTAEGEKLKTDLTAKLNHMLVNVDRVEAGRRSCWRSTERSWKQRWQNFWRIRRLRSPGCQQRLCSMRIRSVLMRKQCVCARIFILCWIRWRVMRGSGESLILSPRR